MKALDGRLAPSSESDPHAEPRRRKAAWFVAAAAAMASLGLVSQTEWSVGATPGDDDATLVPMTPCRLADTRPAPNRVGPNATLGIDDTTTIAARGSNGQCTIPDDAVALLLNVTALGATESGTFLTFWPGGERPLAASLNPAPGQPPTPNAVTTGLTVAGTFDVYNFVGSVDVVIDVNGYYTASSLEELSDDLGVLQNELTALREDVDALRNRTSTLPSGVTVSGFEWINEVIVVDGSPRSLLFSQIDPIRSSSEFVDTGFEPETGMDDLIVDTFEDERCGVDPMTLEPAPEAGVMCLYPVGLSSIDVVALDPSGIVGEIFVTFEHDGMEGDVAVLGFRWVYTAP